MPVSAIVSTVDWTPLIGPDLAVAISNQKSPSVY
jgi:hypothetical protein